MEREYQSIKSPSYRWVITEIIKQIERGTRPYENPWRGAEQTPSNGMTYRAYSGINMLILWSAALNKEFDCHRWLTERQGAALGGHLLDDERDHGTTIFFGKRTHLGPGRSKGLYREYKVYNWVQFRGLPDPRPAPPNLKPGALARFYEVVSRLGADIQYMGKAAQYDSETDVVRVPEPSAFYFPANDLPRTLVHELGHWCLRHSRLNIQVLGEHALMRRAFEEVMVELAAALICNYFEIQPSVRSSDYIASWIAATKQQYGHQPSAAEVVLRVSHDAMRIADYILSFEPAS